MRPGRGVAELLSTGLALAAAGCGFAVQSPDLFLLTRTGQGGTQQILVNDDGTIRCNGGKARTLPDPLLLSARDLATSLDSDVKNKLRLRPPTAASVYSYRVRLQDGTLVFADTDAPGHKELAQAELLMAQALQGPCAGQ
jgi:hypothetical protein